MNHFRHLFILDAVEHLHPTLDSSLKLAKALKTHGSHELYACEQKHFVWDSSDPGPKVLASVLDPDHPKSAADKKVISLSDFSAIHMRKDPPFDLEYIVTSWFLDGARKQTKIYNDPWALRGLNEKLSIFMFKDFIQPGLVSSDPELLFDFLKTSAEGDAVIKPLNLYGGRDIERLQFGASNLDAIKQQLHTITHNGTQTRLIQPFNKAIHQGEVRAFAVAGKPLAWCLKKPKQGEFLANTRAGATLHSYTPSKIEIERVTVAAEKLLQHGVFNVGFDVIGGYISEINLTSPRLLQGDDDKTDYYFEWAKRVNADLTSEKSSR